MTLAVLATESLICDSQSAIDSARRAGVHGFNKSPVGWKTENWGLPNFPSGKTAPLPSVPPSYTKQK